MEWNNKVDVAKSPWLKQELQKRDLSYIGDVVTLRGRLRSPQLKDLIMPSGGVFVPGVYTKPGKVGKDYGLLHVNSKPHRTSGGY